MNVMIKHPFKPGKDGTCEEMLKGIPCLMRKYNQIHDEFDLLTEEPVFILRAQDMSAPALVQQWIVLNSKSSPEKLASAQDILERMRGWPKKKVAD